MDLMVFLMATAYFIGIQLLDIAILYRVEHLGERVEKLINQSERRS